MVLRDARCRVRYPARVVTVADVMAAMQRWYPAEWAESWDRVGLVVGDPDAPVRRILFAVDCVPETVAQAVEQEADLLLTHHPLLLRGVSSVATTSYKGRLVHRMIRSGVALFVAHTNADVAEPGVSSALAACLGLRDTRPLCPTEDGRGHGRIGELPAPSTLAELTAQVAAALPATAGGIRAAGDPQRPVRTVAVCGGAGDSFLTDAAAAGADAYLTADLRHHPVSEYVSDSGPALLDAAHWATEWPWLSDVRTRLTGELGVQGIISSLVTDPWTVHAGQDQTDVPPSLDDLEE